MKASSLISNAKFLPPDNDGNRIVIADESGILHLLKQNNIKTIGGGGTFCGRCQWPGGK